jgi:hypothetical protein
VYVPLPRATPCLGLHPAQGVTLRYGYVPPSGEWITVILPCPELHSALPRVIPCVMDMFPLSGEWITVILSCPGLHPALWISSPFRGLDYCDSVLPRVNTLRYGYHPPSGEWITVILSCPELHPAHAKGYTLRYGYVPPSGEWIIAI